VRCGGCVCVGGRFTGGVVVDVVGGGVGFGLEAGVALRLLPGGFGRAVRRSRCCLKSAISEI
jgi:hypothetical protein